MARHILYILHVGDFQNRSLKSLQHTVLLLGLSHETVWLDIQCLVMYVLQNYFCHLVRKGFLFCVIDIFTSHFECICLFARNLSISVHVSAFAHLVLYTSKICIYFNVLCRLSLSQLAISPFLVICSLSFVEMLCSLVQIAQLSLFLSLSVSLALFRQSMYPDKLVKILHVYCSICHCVTLTLSLSTETLSLSLASLSVSLSPSVSFLSPSLSLPPS